MKWIAGAETDLRQELRNLRDDFSHAIKSDSTGRIEELSDFYTEIIENFLRETLLLGKDFTNQRFKLQGEILWDQWPQLELISRDMLSLQKRVIKTGIWGEWPELEWISRDLMSLQEQVVKTDNIEMIRNTIYIPIKFATRAVMHHNHRLFLQSLRSIPHVYIVTERTDMQPHIKQMLIEICHAHIRELLQFVIGNGLKQSDISDEDRQSYHQFAQHLLFVFQELLRYSCQRRDVESFKKFLKQLSESPDWVYSTSKPVTGGLSSLRVKFEDKKKQMLFGLTAYVMSHLDSEQGKAEQKLFDFYEALSDTLSRELNLLWNITELTILYVDYRQSSAGSYWWVERWDTLADSSTYLMQHNSHIDQFYVVLALNSLKDKQVKDINNLRLPRSVELANLANKNGSLSETLDEIKHSPDKWKHLVNKTAISKIPAFKRLLKIPQNRMESS